MRILITGGGTKIPLDPIRHIGNYSSGRLGSDLALAALKVGLDVTYLCASDARSPFKPNFNLYLEAFEQVESQFQTIHQDYCQYKNQYREYRFEDFADYQSKLKDLLEEEQPAIVILAAAVSDYLVDNPSKDKIKSATDLNIRLTLAPKIIKNVKEWLPQTFLVGFKLEVDVREHILIQRALESLKKNQLDLVVANDFGSIQKKNHELFVIEQNGTYEKYTDHLAPKLIQRCIKRWS